MLGAIYHTCELPPKVFLPSVQIKLVITTRLVCHYGGRTSYTFYTVIIIYTNIVRGNTRTVHSITNSFFVVVVAMIPFEGSCPKTKPPPLLSLHRPTSSSLGGPNMRGPLSSHISHSGPSSSRGPLLHTAPPFHPGSRGLRGAPPSLKSARLPLLASPGGFLLPSNQLMYFTHFFF